MIGKETKFTIKDMFIFQNESIGFNRFGNDVTKRFLNTIPDLLAEIDRLKQGRKIASVDDAQGLINQIKIRDIKITALEDAVKAFTHKQILSKSGSNSFYKCVFCRSVSHLGDTVISHKCDCEGIKALAKLDEGTK